ncbi:hypothetical protein B0H16DRAFT_1463846 [Mycena metata]|uniref:Uncharacterized protein n=1 Tax=Mycena metata TaxID=1033252 RepID=A0AAD7N2R8_9AGAR|nr:hypothetical protein B0H16DRAFT_1463846 [Mycena metata]
MPLHTQLALQSPRQHSGTWVFLHIIHAALHFKFAASEPDVACCATLRSFKNPISYIGHGGGCGQGATAVFPKSKTSWYVYRFQEDRLGGLKSSNEAGGRQLNEVIAVIQDSTHLERKKTFKELGSGRC